MHRQHAPCLYMGLCRLKVRATGCCVVLPHGAVGLSAVCDGGIY